MEKELNDQRSRLTAEAVVMGQCGAPSRLRLDGHKKVKIDQLSMLLGVDLIESNEGIGMEGVIDSIRELTKLRLAEKGQVNGTKSLLIEDLGLVFQDR